MCYEYRAFFLLNPRGVQCIEEMGAHLMFVFISSENSLNKLKSLAVIDSICKCPKNGLGFLPEW